MGDDELKRMIIDTLNESTSYDHFEEQTVDDAIKLAKSLIFTLSSEGSQVTRTTESDGNSRIPIQTNFLSLLRVDRVGDCGLPMITVMEAEDYQSGFRGCSHNDQTPIGWVKDPESPRALWIVPAPAPGTEVSYTVVTAESNETPQHLFNMVRHYALSICYEKAHGNNSNSMQHREKAFEELSAYMRMKEQASG